MIKSYKDLEVWQKSVNLVTKVYSMTAVFPQEEKYNLVSQIRRSAVSIPSNIAEGSKRKNTKELIQFLHIAAGSLSELETQIIISHNLGFIDKNMITKEIEEVGKMLSGLLSSLTTKHRPLNT
jgi:four helix bundle protein